jgi:hypothetical protein
VAGQLPNNNWRNSNINRNLGTPILIPFLFFKV